MTEDGPTVHSSRHQAFCRAPTAKPRKAKPPRKSKRKRTWKRHSFPPYFFGNFANCVISASYSFSRLLLAYLSLRAAMHHAGTPPPVGPCFRLFAVTKFSRVIGLKYNQKELPNSELQLQLEDRPGHKKKVRLNQWF